MNFLRFISWNKSFSKEEYKIKDECICKTSSGLFITKRQASAITSTFLFLIMFILIFGYFWGQKKAIEEFTNKVVNDSFADQVNYSMYSLYGDSSAVDVEDEESIQEKGVQVN